MDKQTIRILEFDSILEILKRYAQSPLGALEIQDLTVENDPVMIRSRLNAVAEMSALLKERGRPSLQESYDIRPLLNRVQIEGACLGPEDLIPIHHIIHAAQGLKRFLGKDEDNFPLLVQEAGQLDPLLDLGRAIDETVDHRGGIKDSASTELAAVRRKIRHQKEKVKERLETILSSEGLKTVVQERLVTIRNDRYVIPLKPDFSGKIQGIIHDHSASRATVYVEPSGTVEMNNHLSRLASEEAEEIHRILLDISGQVRSSLDPLHRNVGVLARMDLRLAMALYAEACHGVIPEILGEQKIDFRGARHPLLLEKRQGPEKEEAVPIDLKIGEDYRTLIITGPNTGGKTVSLKTLGLLVLMTQAGIPIPVQKGSSMGIFGDVIADIGDEQSIQEDLSTFSSHIRNIVRILKESGMGSLVLLDELGTGTDPREGAALGMAILEELTRKGSLTAATTHYEEIKHYAYRTEGVMNASVAFDTRELRPTFTLEYGHLGTSHAFEISERIGMPGEILDRAKQKISDIDRTTAQLIDELEQGIQVNREGQKGLIRKQKEMEQHLAAKDQEKEKALKEAQKLLRELKEEFARTKKRARKLLKVAELGNRPGLDREIHLLDQELKTDFGMPLPAPEPVNMQEIAPGLQVEISGTGKKGVVLKGPDKRGRVHLLCNGLKVEVAASLLKSISGEPLAERHNVAMGAELQDHEEISPSINLIGLRAEEARKQTESYLDHAHLGNLRHVKIIHGVGSGVLRNVVAEILKSHPLVARFSSGSQAEGGAGVTEVELVS